MQNETWNDSRTNRIDLKISTSSITLSSLKGKNNPYKIREFVNLGTYNPNYNQKYNYHLLFLYKKTPINFMAAFFVDVKRQLNENLEKRYFTKPSMKQITRKAMKNNDIKQNKKKWKNMNFYWCTFYLFLASLLFSITKIFFIFTAVSYCIKLSANFVILQNVYFPNLLCIIYDVEIMNIKYHFDSDN